MVETGICVCVCCSAYNCIFIPCYMKLSDWGGSLFLVLLLVLFTFAAVQALESSRESEGERRPVQFI